MDGWMVLQDLEGFCKMDGMMSHKMEMCPKRWMDG